MKLDCGSSGYYSTRRETLGASKGRLRSLLPLVRIKEEGVTWQYNLAELNSSDIKTESLALSAYIYDYTARRFSRRR